MDTTNYAMKRLHASCLEKGPLCIGLDTDPSYLPKKIVSSYKTPADAVLAYNKTLIEATISHAACYKVQIAYYEAMGLEGMRVYSETLKAVKDAGVPVIADIKRGDIADTAHAYARAHFSGDFEADIVTINPYMGFDTLEPFLEYIEKFQKGIFVLLRTSNPGMKDIEWLRVADNDKRVFTTIGDALSDMGQRFDGPGDHPCSSIGAVVGCTEEIDARIIRDRYPDMFFLIPGYGAQGGAPRIAATLLDHAGGTVNSSRGILLAWKKDAQCIEDDKCNALSLNQMTLAAQRAAEKAKNELMLAKKELSSTSVPQKEVTDV
ncbi:MAG TPA: orotidine-5'-phosphate decarboxylase [Treponema sp.]|nr:orotidine-5'-phosphate decarboxylase [Treponema sp.]